MSIISVENLTKIYPVAVKKPGFKGTLNHFFKRKYRDVKAVENISFKLNKGEMVGFLGPNGAGKTTTLKMLTGLIYPSSGNVRVAGDTPFRRKANFLRKISLVMGQKQQLIWDLPAQDSFKINGAIYQIPEDIFKKRLGELIEMLSLEGKLNKPVRKLSLGERMKAELLASLLHQPEVLFLDEPTLGLDVNAQVAVRDFLREYNQRYDATILLTSHYMADITALCERVLLIYEGKLIYNGNLEALLNKFSPYREVTVELVSPMSRDNLEKYGEIEAIDGQVVRFLIERKELKLTIAKILDELNLIDFSVSDPPIEDIIGKAFQGNQLLIDVPS